MNQVVIKNVLRLIGISLLQVMVLSRISFSGGGFDFIHIIIYPYIILMLPFKMRKTLVLLYSFGLGLFIDMFYNSPGVHAGALVIMAYLRNTVLRILEPNDGYDIASSPTLDTMGINWFLTYTSVLLFIFLFAYFSIEAFTFVYIYNIMLRTIFSFIPSFVIIYLLQLVFKSKY